MSVTVEFNLMPGFESKIKKQVGKVVRQTAFAATANAVNRIQSGTKTGCAYRRSALAKNLKSGGRLATHLAGMGIVGGEDSKTGKTRFVVGYTIHRASAPGEAPATDTGTLAGSADVVEVDALTQEVSFSVEYAEALEFGTANGRIAARPYLRPAISDVAEGFEDAITSAINEAISNARGR